MKIPVPLFFSLNSGISSSLLSLYKSPVSQLWMGLLGEVLVACHAEEITLFDMDLRPASMQSLAESKPRRPFFRHRTLFALAPQLQLHIHPFFHSHCLNLFHSQTKCRVLANRCRLLRSFLLHPTTILYFQPPFNLIHIRLLRRFQLPKIPWWYISLTKPIVSFGWLLHHSPQKTIGLSDNQKTFRDARDEDVDTQTIFEVERPATFDYGAGAEQASGNLFKVCTSSLFSVPEFIFNFLLADSLATHPQIYLL